MAASSQDFEKQVFYHVLLISEDTGEIATFSQLIQKFVYCRLEVKSRIEDVLELSDKFAFDLIVLSQSEDSASLLFDLDELKRVSPATSVILVTSKPTVEQAVLAIRAGAEDYLSKPVKPEAFELAVKRGLKIEQHISVHHLAYIDDVTGLSNVRYLNHFLEKEIIKAKTADTSVAVLFMDVDQFKRINDQYGHAIGTRMLRDFAYQLKKSVRDKDTVFRYGGDEFIAVLSPGDLAMANSVAERIRSSVTSKAFFDGQEHRLSITLSIGVALFPNHGKDKKEVIEAADRAMYQAKLTRNRIVVATPAQKKKVRVPRIVEKEL